MLSQCDSEGNQFILMEVIVDHKVTDKALLKPREMHFITNSWQHHKKTTQGWQICVEWHDGLTLWERLSSLKESYPVELAEYAVAKGIEHQPDFCWWVLQVLRKHDHVITAVNKRYHKQTHKFGFKVPKTVKHAIKIDQVNSNTLWQDAIAKEMEAVHVAFKILNNDEQSLLELVNLNLLWELAPRCYQLPWMSMVNIVENWVDCQNEAYHTVRITPSNSVVWGKNLQKLTKV